MDLLMKTKKTTRWSSELSFIWATAGAAIGLGNIWKFPYMAGENGGGSFVLVYLLSVFLLGVPVMMAEIVIGALARRNSVDSISFLSSQFNRSSKWTFMAWWGLAGLLLILSFYCVVSAWALYYLFITFFASSTFIAQTDFARVWQELLASPTTLIIFQILFIALTFITVALGVKKGIEKVSQILMPLLLCLLLALSLYGFFSYEKDFLKACHFLFSFQWSELTPQVIVEALGHAFFTLAVGAGAMCVYGAYLPQKASISRSVLITATLDITVALLAGLAIFPFIFKAGLELKSGPSLMFIALPQAFQVIGSSQLLVSLFFLLLVFAALTSSINIAEALVLSFSDRLKKTRVQACLLVAFLVFLLGLLSVFSFNVFSDFKVFDRWDLFTFITGLVTNIILPFGGLFFSFYVGWLIPTSELKSLLKINPFFFNCFIFLLRFFVPLAITAIILSSFYGFS